MQTKNVTMTVDEFVKLPSSRVQSKKGGINEDRKNALKQEAIRKFSVSKKDLMQFLQGQIVGTPLRISSQHNVKVAGHHRGEVMAELVKEGYLSPDAKITVVDLTDCTKEELTQTVILDNFATNTRNKKEQVTSYQYPFQAAFFQPIQDIITNIEKTKGKFFGKSPRGFTQYVGMYFHKNPSELELLSKGCATNVTADKLYGMRKHTGDILGVVSVEPNGSLTEKKAIASLTKAYETLWQVANQVKLTDSDVPFNLPLQWLIISACLRGEVINFDSQRKGVISVPRLLRMFVTHDRKLLLFNKLHNINPELQETKMLLLLRGE